jgi:imidazolonepropionase-like amidohydrolase
VNMIFRPFVVFVLLMAMHTAAAETQATTTVFVNVTLVHPERDEIVTGQTVIVEGERIQSVTANEMAKLPADARIIDATDQFLSPGLVEMHAHVPEARMGQEYLHDTLFLWVAHGITTIRNMSGEPDHLILREKLAQHEVLGPRMYTSGPRFSGARVKDAGARVAAQADAGYDLIKVHMKLSPSVYDDVVAAASEHQIDVAGHVAEDIGLWRALEAKQKSIDHLDAYFRAMVPEDVDVSEIKDQLLGLAYMPYIDPESMALVAQATADAGIWNAPTLTLAENFIGPYDAAASAVELQYLPPRMAKSWVAIVTGFQKMLADPEQAQQFLNARKQLVMALHDVGAGLLLGSDTPQMMNVPGFSTHNELDLLIEAGLTPAEAITAGTFNPAIYFGAESSFGRIQKGLAADFILSSDNPLKNPKTLRTPKGVMVRGRWLDEDELRSGLAAIAAKNAE